MPTSALFSTDFLNADFFQKNRKAVLQAMKKNSLAVLSATQLNPPEYNPKYDWRQNTDFYYLCGITDADCFLLLAKGEKEEESTLYIPEYDAVLERWEGKILEAKEATKISGIEQIFPKSYFYNHLHKILSKQESIYVQEKSSPILGGISAYEKLLSEITLHNPTLKRENVNSILDPLRWIKQPEEIALIKKAISITVASFQEAAQKIIPGNFEYEIEAEIAYGYRKRGAAGHAFPAIIGAGENSCFLHYTKNLSQLKKEDVLLLDSGATYQKYHADITRTFPVGGKFTAEAENYYALNLEIQKKVLEGLKVGMTFTEYFALCTHHQNEILTQAKVIKNEAERKKYTIHNVGHSLGLDVHDRFCMDYQFQIGSLITVEPGLYFPEKKIGIRVEDDVLFTKNGIEILTAAAPKELKEVEKMVG